ncbi:nucleotide disphospho-sugar-binding domain-containing protein [Actinoplanes sp. NPDC049548]|uniref:nucleotide disphospho-sugar-binding domain-containing protein n=1 Tax=Actinoplanes sp. NPDC049548 TaxID=3155152 RepID=UPI00341BF11B
MRLLFTTYAERAHLLPMVPLAWSALAAGHDVRMATTPSLIDAVERTGLPAVSVGHDIDVETRLARGDLAPRDAKSDDPADSVQARVLENMANLMFDHCDAMSEDLVAFGRRWKPDLVVFDPVTYAGSVAGEVLGVPTVGHLYGMARLLRLELRGLTSDEPLPGYLELFRRFGAEPRIDPTAWVDPRPASLRWSEEDAVLPAASIKQRIPMRYIPYNGPGTAPDWLQKPGDRPRVCITWGTTQQRKMGVGVIDFFREVVHEVAKLDVEVLVTVGAAKPEYVARLGELPENVRPVGWVPLNMLLTTCSAIVHTGGTGTMMTAAACGVPQLGITRILEGVYNTEQLVSTGAARQITEEGADLAEVREAVAALIGDPAYRTAAAALQAEISEQPAPADVVPALLDLAR